MIIGLLLLLAALCLSSSGAQIGQPHSTVIKLTASNFDEHINDPSNGLWLLKFYAPWCGHCQKMAPVLDAVAPYLAGKLAIGKVDCTSEKNLCKRFDVKGYPTMKYYRDGDYQDYPLGRDKDSIINFGEKMSERAVKMVSSYEGAHEQLLGKTPVAFLVYDPSASSSAANESIDNSGASADEKLVEKLIQSTERTRTFGQIARRLQAQGTFGMLLPETPEEEVARFFLEEGSTSAAPGGGFIARIEDGIPTRLYEGELDSVSFLEFVEAQNLATVVHLDGNNFRFVTRRGKPVALAAIDPSDGARTDKFKNELKRYAVRGERRDDYIFATIDGTKWDKFLEQFSITKESLPELFVIDTPARTYWQNSTVVGISDFVEAVKSGEIEPRVQEKPKKGVADQLFQVFVDWMPWSLFAMLSIFVLVFYLSFPSMDGDLGRPPRPDFVGPPSTEKPGATEVPSETKKEQ